MNWQPFIRVVSKGIHPFGQGEFGHNPWWFKENNYHGGLKIITTKPTPKPTLATWPIIHFFTQKQANPNQIGSGQPKLGPKPAQLKWISTQPKLGSINGKR